MTDLFGVRAMTAMDDMVSDDPEDDEENVSIDRLDRFSYGLTPYDAVAFQRRGASLLVSFETASDPDVALKTHRSRLHELADDMDWSHLSLASRGATLFRAPEVITFIDALADSTLFDQFDDVLFYGAGVGGHGALSYALTAPTARVLAIAPLVGLDGRNGPTDPRFDLEDGIDISERYAVNDANLQAAGDVFLVLDAADLADNAQARCLTGANIHTLICRDVGEVLERALNDLGVLDDLLVHAMDGVLTPQLFYAEMRVARRENSAYLRRLTARLIERDRPLLEAMAVRNVAYRTGRKRFERRLAQLEAALIERGIALPPPLDPDRTSG
ncbi:hypothetical protein [Oceaniglobus indicus]|uniref:hypothetical protein n=1 Tax=Oceaniglobus indicus TaxID=2047749 RepID=UPI000C181241|nr:hypothetical protein [Oceaniglobus indicus]